MPSLANLRVKAAGQQDEHAGESGHEKADQAVEILRRGGRVDVERQIGPQSHDFGVDAAETSGKKKIHGVLGMLKVLPGFAQICTKRELGLQSIGRTVFGAARKPAGSEREEQAAEGYAGRD